MVDPTLWTIRPAFGVAGGPDEIVLTDAGLSRAYSVGAQVREGAPSQALEALDNAGGSAYLETGCAGKVYPTEIAKHFDRCAWAVLKRLGYVEPIAPNHDRGTGEGVRLTVVGRNAAMAGECARLELIARVRCERGLSDT